MPKLKIMVGLPGVGKTTFCQNRMGESDVRVSMDDLQQMLGGGTYNNYRRELKHLYAQVERDAVLAALTAGHDVWLDRTNMDTKRRAKYIGMARAAEAEVHVVDFTHQKIRDAFTTNELLDRRMTAPRNITREQWDSVIVRMVAEYSVPNLSEGLDGLYFVQPEELK